jgi:hypothetical protein
VAALRARRARIKPAQVVGAAGAQTTRIAALPVNALNSTKQRPPCEGEEDRVHGKSDWHHAPGNCDPGSRSTAIALKRTRCRARWRIQPDHVVPSWRCPCTRERGYFQRAPHGAEREAKPIIHAQGGGRSRHISPLWRLEQRRCANKSIARRRSFRMCIDFKHLVHAASKCSLSDKPDLSRNRWCKERCFLIVEFHVAPVVPGPGN